MLRRFNTFHTRSRLKTESKWKIQVSTQCAMDAACARVVHVYMRCMFAIRQIIFKFVTTFKTLICTLKSKVTTDSIEKHHIIKQIYRKWRNVTKPWLEVQNKFTSSPTADILKRIVKTTMHTCSNDIKTSATIHRYENRAQFQGN